MLIELTLAMALLTTIGLVVFKSSIDVMAPRQWTIYQNMTDAYLSYEESYAKRISFKELTSMDSPWPVFPDRKSTKIEIGKFPGGNPVTATIFRTRLPDNNNLPSAGGSGNALSNPSEMETWQLQSHLSYFIGDDEYVKSRTVVRSQ